MSEKTGVSAVTPPVAQPVNVASSAPSTANVTPVRIPPVPPSPSALRQPSVNGAERQPSNQKVQFSIDNPTAKSIAGDTSGIKRKSTPIVSDRFNKKKKFVEEQISRSRSSLMVEASLRSNAGASKTLPTDRPSVCKTLNPLQSTPKRPITLNTNASRDKDHNGPGLARLTSDFGPTASSSNVSNGTPNPRTPTITPENLSRPLSFQLNKSSNDVSSLNSQLNGSMNASFNNVSSRANEAPQPPSVPPSTTTQPPSQLLSQPPPPSTKPVTVKQETVESNKENSEHSVIEVSSEDEGDKRSDNNAHSTNSKPPTATTVKQEDVKPDVSALKPSLFAQKVDLKYGLGRFCVQPSKSAPKSKKIIHSVSNIFNFQDEYLYIGLTTGPIKRVNMNDPKDTTMFVCGKDPAFACFFLKDLGRIYIVGIDGLIRWYDVRTGQLISYKNAKITIMCMERCTEDSHDFTVGLNDGNLWRFDASKNEVVDQFKVSSHAIVNVFHIDHNNLLYCEDSCLYRFNWQTKKVSLMQKNCRWPTVIRIHEELLYVLHMIGGEQNAMHLVTFDLKTLMPKNTIQFDSFFRNFFMIEDKIFLIGLKYLIQCFSITDWSLVFSAYYLDNEILSAWLLNSKTLLIGDNHGYLDSIDLDLSNIQHCDKCNIPFLRLQDLEYHFVESKTCSPSP